MAAVYTSTSAWPAIWLGSVALNLGIALQNGNLGWSSLALALGIASAVTLQALLARYLVVRGGRAGWRTMEEESQILRSLVLAGPLACLVASSLAVPMLGWGQMVPGGDYVNAWWNWWSGDVLGVLVVMSRGDWAQRAGAG